MVLLSYSPTEHNTILQPLQIGHGHGPIQFFAKHLPDTLIYIEMKHLATHLLFWPNVHCLEICPSPQLSRPRPASICVHRQSDRQTDKETEL